MNQIKLSLIASILLLMAGTASVKAQTALGGVKGGLNLSNLYIEDVEDENVRTGFHVGVFTQLMITENLAIQPELNYSTKGAKAEYNIFGITGETKFNLSYLDIPILATFKLGDDADIHIGPYFGYLIGVSTSTEGDFGSGNSELDRDDYKKLDYGLAGGMSLNFNPLIIGLRYNYGLNKIADSDEAETLIGDAKNSVAQVYLAFNLK